MNTDSNMSEEYYGRDSSCDGESEDEENEFTWPPELLHTPVPRLKRQQIQRNNAACEGRERERGGLEVGSEAQGRAQGVQREVGGGMRGRGSGGVGVQRPGWDRSFELDGFQEFQDLLDAMDFTGDYESDDKNYYENLGDEEEDFWNSYGDMF